MGKQTSGNHLLLVRNINYFLLILGLCPLISNSWGPGMGLTNERKYSPAQGCCPQPKAILRVGGTRKFLP